MTTKQVYVAIGIDHEGYVEVAVYEELPDDAEMSRDLGHPPVIKVATVILPVPEAVAADPEYVIDFTNDDDDSEEPQLDTTDKE
jgi:hypothetical protein